MLQNAQKVQKLVPVMTNLKYVSRYFPYKHIPSCILSSQVITPSIPSRRLEVSIYLSTSYFIFNYFSFFFHSPSPHGFVSLKIYKYLYSSFVRFWEGAKIYANVHFVIFTQVLLIIQYGFKDLDHPNSCLWNVLQLNRDAQIFIPSFQKFQFH